MIMNFSSVLPVFPLYAVVFLSRSETLMLRL
jgi:hypothetical protein